MKITKILQELYALGKTDADLAVKLKKNPTTIYRWRKGDTAPTYCEEQTIRRIYAQVKR